MKIYWKGAWLGYAVLVSGALAALLILTIPPWHKGTQGLALIGWNAWWTSCCLFVVFLGTWALRGVIRFVGRALGTRP